MIPYKNIKCHFVKTRKKNMQNDTIQLKMKRSTKITEKNVTEILNVT